MLVNYKGIKPELVAKEINTMMSKVDKELKKIPTEQGKITYAERKLLKYIKANNFTKVLAFKDCYEGNTGDTLNVENITLPYRNEFNSLTNTADTLDTLIKTLIPFLDIYFPE